MTVALVRVLDAYCPNHGSFKWNKLWVEGTGEAHNLWTAAAVRMFVERGCKECGARIVVATESAEGISQGFPARSGES